MPTPSLLEVESHIRNLKLALKRSGAPSKMIDSISTKALRTGRKVNGQFATNRECRWKINPSHPQFANELDCKMIFAKLLAQIFCFDNAPDFPASAIKSEIQACYLNVAMKPGTFRDSLLLERFDYNEMVQEYSESIHGFSNYHIGHEDPTLKPKHLPGNIAWRTHRSNLIQGDMTLRESRIYLVKLIGRYFELGELKIE